MGVGPAVRDVPMPTAPRRDSGLSTKSCQQGEPPAGALESIAEEGLVGRAAGRRPTIWSSADPAQQELLAVRRRSDRPASGPTVGPPPRRGRGEWGPTAARQCLPYLVGDLVAVRMNGRAEEGPHPVGAGAVVLHGAERARPTAPAAVPARQPACTAARTPASGSTEREGDAVG